jgi:hypothetical protein
MSNPDISDRTSRTKSCSVSLEKGLEHRLLAYAAAASAAGVAVISLAQPCQAEIVYTKAHQHINPNSSYSLDLNNDGVVDFTFYNARSSFRSGGRRVAWSQNLWVRGAGTNQVWDNYGPSSFAWALAAGRVVEPGDNFLGYGHMDRCKGSNGGSNVSTFGSWLEEGPQYHYLGFAFSIDGQTHYGWARLNSKVTGRDCKSTVLLTGYAYETVAGQAIETGKMRGEDAGDEASATAGTLGRLALGSTQSARPDSQGQGSEK